MLSCGEIAELLDAYLDGELDPELSIRILSHLEHCAGCQELLDERTLETAMIRTSFPVPDLAPDFKDQVMAKICREANRSRFFPSLSAIINRPWLAPALAGMLLFVGVYGAFSLELPSPAPDESIRLQLEAGKESPALDQVRVGGSQDSTNNGTQNNPDKETMKISANGFQMPQDRLQNGAADAKTDGARRMPQAAPGMRMLFSGESAQHLPDNALETTNPDDLAGAGYTLFTPGYLPPGFVQETAVIQDFSCDSKVKAPSGQKPVELLFTNIQTGAVISLNIYPECSPAASISVQSDNIQGGEPSITWYAQKEGIRFVLTLTGNLSPEELKKVANSIK